MPLTDYSLNLAADAITNRSIGVRIHSGDPGTAGTSNRIGTHEIDVAASGWSAASGGDSSNSSAVEFGQLDSANAHTVSHYSLWDGSNFMGRESLASSVAVAAGEHFTIEANSITIMGSSS